MATITYYNLDQSGKYEAITGAEIPTPPSDRYRFACWVPGYAIDTDGIVSGINDDAIVGVSATITAIYEDGRDEESDAMILASKPDYFSNGILVGDKAASKAERVWATDTFVLAKVEDIKIKVCQEHGRAGDSIKSVSVEVGGTSVDVQSDNDGFYTFSVPDVKGVSFAIEIDTETWADKQADENNVTIDCYAAYHYSYAHKADFTYTEYDGAPAKTFAVKEYDSIPNRALKEYADKLNFPVRSAGYWTFDGWQRLSDLPDQGEQENDITFPAIFSKARVKIPVLGVAGCESITSSWDDNYTEIQLQKGEYEGVYLYNQVRNIYYQQTHNEEGEGIAKCNSAFLGIGTVKKQEQEEYVFSAPNGICLKAIERGEDSTGSKGYSQEYLRDSVGVLPFPFAKNAYATVVIPETSADKVNYTDGFGKQYTKKLINEEGGIVEQEPKPRVITRQVVNTLGNMGSQAQFFAQCGGIYTFDEDVCAAIGGYPKGAILQFYQEETNALRTVFGLVEDNKWNFLENGVDGVHWKYIDDNPILDLKVDYGDYEDLSDTLFVESGIPELYEVPYDGFLQMHAFSFIDLHSTLREEQENMRNVVTNVEENPLWPDLVDNTKRYILYKEDINGAFGTSMTGQVFLDIYKKDTESMNSIMIRSEACINHLAQVWTYGQYRQGIFYTFKTSPYVVTQGSVFLNKGDKIRVRGTYIDSHISEDDYPNHNYNTSTARYTDQEVTRHYLLKYAMLYRTEWGEGQ